MNSQRQPNLSTFGPRPRMSTRLQMANGLSLRKSKGRFRSKTLMKINEECQKRQANMKCMNLSKSNHNLHDQRVSVTTQGANKVSKHASQSTNLRLENYLNPSSDFKCSKPSRVSNAHPSKILETLVSRKSKDGSNTILRCPEQSHHLKTNGGLVCNVDSSCQAHLKAMPNLTRKANNVATSNLNNGSLGSRWRGKSNSYQGEDINVGKDGTKTSKLLKSGEVSRKSNIPVRSRLLNPNKDDPNKMKGSQDEVVTKEEGMEGHTGEGRATCGNRHKQTNTTKTNDAPNLSSLFTDGGNDSGAVQKDLTSRPLKRRRYIEANTDEEDNGGDQHLVHVEDATAKLKPQIAASKHSVEQQCHCCSKPIDIPRWSGLFKVDGNKYISLAGHLSSKSCEKVWKLSSLPQVVQVTKVPRVAAWSKIFKASKPTGDSIGLYLFPPEMRHDEELDQLVNEVMDKDLLLRAEVGEAEMLIFPSVLLPERYQTFQTKHYLWAAFNAKEDKNAIIVEQEEHEEKHVSNQLDDVQSEELDQEMVLTKSAMLLENKQLPAKSIQEVEACCVQGPTNMCLEHESPEERRLKDSLHRAVCTTAPSTAFATTTATVPTEALSFTTDTASFPPNHGLIRPSMEAPSRSSTFFGIVVRQASDVELEVKEFIQEMEHKGALVTVMQGKAIGGGPWPATSRPLCSSCRE